MGIAVRLTVVMQKTSSSAISLRIYFQRTKNPETPIIANSTGQSWRIRPLVETAAMKALQMKNWNVDQTLSLLTMSLSLKRLWWQNGIWFAANPSRLLWSSACTCLVSWSAAFWPAGWRISLDGKRLWCSQSYAPHWHLFLELSCQNTTPILLQGDLNIS